MRFALIFALLVSGTYSFSQRFNFVNYSLEEGLPQSQVSDICQDKQGYLWILTKAGLSRFDGIQFQSFSTEDGLPNNQVDKIYIDKSGTVWVATPGGIANYEQGNGFQSFRFSDTADLEYGVNDFSELNGSMYLATDEGLLLFENEEFNLLTANIDLSLSMRAIVSRGDSLLICGSRNGLFTYDGHEFTHFQNDRMDSLNVSDIFLRGNELIVSTYGDGILILDLESGSLRSPLFPEHRIRSVYANQESILCATKYGAIEITEDTIFHYGVHNGLSFENIACVFIDREENLWLGSDGKGLMKLTGKSVISYTKSDGLSSDAVMSIAQDSSGAYFFGTYDAGVTVWRDYGDTSMVVGYNTDLKNLTVWAVQMERGNKCWVGSYEGVDLIEAGRVYADQKIDSIVDGFRVRTFLFVGDSLKFIGGSGGLIRVLGDDVSLMFKSLELDVNEVIRVDNFLYIATTTGLFRSGLHGEAAEQIPLTDNYVRSLAADRDGNIWIGTKGTGLFVLKQNGSILPFYLDRDDTKSKTILGLITDRYGNIWVGTLNGVYEILLQNGHKQIGINHYGRSEGLITLECNQNALFEDQQGYIWVGTSEGLIRIDPRLNDDLFHFRKPELHITGVRLFLENFDFGDYVTGMDEAAGVPRSIVLPYDKNHLTFDFIGINLKDPEGVRYQYRLLGAEENWSPLTEDRYATYSFIAHGEYDFEVRAVNRSGDWSEINRMHIVILPPFWLTWWFICILVLFVVALIILIFRIRIRAITQRQENERLGFKNRLLFLEQQSLNASMNRHFIFNSLNSIQYFINSSNKLAANKYLTSFAKLIRKNLDSSQANNFIVTLKEEIERIELYLSLEKMRFEGKFDYVTEMDPAIDADSIEIPSMILQPFVENSIIHGVLPLDRKGLIQLKIYLEFGFLVFEVIDDGIGIDSSLELKKHRKSEETHDSMGMEITNRRIELLRKLTGENLMIIGPFQINNEQGQSLGTKVIIKINIENQGES